MLRTVSVYFFLNLKCHLYIFDWLPRQTLVDTSSSKKMTLPLPRMWASISHSCLYLYHHSEHSPPGKWESCTMENVIHDDPDLIQKSVQWTGQGYLCSKFCQAHGWISLELGAQLVHHWCTTGTSLHSMSFVKLWHWKLAMLDGKRCESAHTMAMGEGQICSHRQPHGSRVHQPRFLSTTQVQVLSIARHC